MQLKQAKYKCKLNNDAYISTPVVLVGILLLLFMVILFVEAVQISSKGFEAREAAHTISKQISVAGEINSSTASLAKSLCEDMMRDKEKISEGRMIVISIEDESGSQIQSWGYSVVGDSEAEDFTLANENKTINGKTIPKNKIQLGDTVVVTVYIYNGATTSGISDGKLWNEADPNATNTSTIKVKSTAVSQIYWKELDVQ